MPLDCKIVMQRYLPPFITARIDIGALQYLERVGMIWQRVGSVNHEDRTIINSAGVTNSGESSCRSFEWLQERSLCR